jgi:hypothetical protein
MRNRSRMLNLIATEGHHRFGETKVGSELSCTFDFVIRRKRHRYRSERGFPVRQLRAFSNAPKPQSKPYLLFFLTRLHFLRVRAREGLLVSTQGSRGLLRA